jgi:putative addiction module CopG family antidote
MVRIRMNIALPARWKKFIESRVASGRYGSEGELVHVALELLERRDAQVDALKKEIEAGRRSGKPRRYDPEGIKRRGRAKLAARKR